MKIEVLGVSFDNVTMKEALDRAQELISAGGHHYVVTPNTEFVQMAKKDRQFCALLNGADLAIPDGIGVVYGAKILGRPLKERVPGVEFAAGLCQRMSRQGGRLFLLGAKPGVAEMATTRLQQDYPGLNVCGVHDGYFKDSQPVVEAIRMAEADVVFVCLGAPKQEHWMAKYAEACGAKLLVGLGGSLDVFAGQVKRAPQSWQRLGLEWLYRLVKQPSRISRMAKLPLFLVDAAVGRILGK